MRRGLTWRSWLHIALVVGVGSIGQIPRAADAGCACGVWPGRTIVNICLKDSEDGCVPSVWDAPAQDSLADWNRFADLWLVAQNRTDSIIFNDGLNSIAWLTREQTNERYGVNLGQSTLAVTFSTGQPDLPNGAECPLPDDLQCVPQQEADVVMLLDWQWSTDSDLVFEARRQGDTDLFSFRQVLAHEVGHMMGLLHESEIPALMFPAYQNFRGMDLTGDDVEIARLAYPDLATDFSDMAMMGFGIADNGDYVSMSVRALGDQPGTDQFEINGLAAVNRSADSGLASMSVRVDGAEVGVLSCDAVPAYAFCNIGSPFSFTIPAAAEIGVAQVEVVLTDPHVGALAGNDVIFVGVLEQDIDGDGFTPSAGDCNDDNPAVNPGALEVCNNVDDDCDVLVDEGVDGSPLTEACYDGPAGTADVGACVSGTRACVAGAFEATCQGQVLPVGESCDGTDEDCDGEVDEDAVGMPLAISCYSGPDGTNGVGRCTAGVSTCQGGAFGTCVGEQTPVAEACNSVDDDCDGQTDEGASGAPLTEACYSGPAGTAGVGQCVAGTRTCQAGVIGPCQGEVLPAAAETCNGVDDDCDGQTDEAQGAGPVCAAPDPDAGVPPDGGVPPGGSPDAGVDPGGDDDEGGGGGCTGVPRSTASRFGTLLWLGAVVVVMRRARRRMA